MPANHTEVEKRLWEAADELRANSKLKSSEYSVPVLDLIFLRYADQKFAEAEKKLTAAGSGRRKLGKTDYQAQGCALHTGKVAVCEPAESARGSGPRQGERSDEGHRGRE
jgi:type I restriction-modification system DNA methylase subunit